MKLDNVHTSTSSENKGIAVTLAAAIKLALRRKCLPLLPPVDLANGLPWISLIVMQRRSLTSEEESILAMIQDGYGPQNNVDEVLFSDSDEAAMFIESLDGTMPLMVNLTVVAVLRGNGTIPSDEELKQRWLLL